MTQDLFPLPSPPPAEARLIVPYPDAGITFKTSKRLVDILKDNHEKWHCFCDKQNCFHKYFYIYLFRIPLLKPLCSHAAHHAVALWSLGANEQALKTGYETDKTFQLDAIKSPEEITKATWKQHLGEDRSVPTSTRTVDRSLILLYKAFTSLILTSSQRPFKTKAQTPSFTSIYSHSTRILVTMSRNPPC